MKKGILTFLAIMLSISVLSATCFAEQTTYYGKKTLLKAFEKYNNCTEDEWQEFFDDYLSVAGGPNSTSLDNEACEKIRKSEDYLLSVTYRDITQTENESCYTGDFYFYLVLNDGSEYTFHCNTCSRNVYTIKEILNYSGISNSEDIVYISLRDKSSQDDVITVYNLTPYSTGWNNVNGDKYYVNKDGTLATKSAIINDIRYKFTSDGVCHGKYTGWVKTTKAKRYYKNGVMVTKSCIINNIRYKFSSDGICLGKYTGWTRTSDGERTYWKNGKKQNQKT